MRQIRATEPQQHVVQTCFSRSAGSWLGDCGRSASATGHPGVTGGKTEVLHFLVDGQQSPDLELSGVETFYAVTHALSHQVLYAPLRQQVYWHAENLNEAI